MASNSRAESTLTSTNIIRSQLLAENGVDGFFSTRQGDLSLPPYQSLNFDPEVNKNKHLALNMARLIDHCTLNTEPHQAMQVHQCHHLWCSGPGSSHQIEADILLTQARATAVAVRTADCLPLLLAEPNTNIVAAVHAGWRGTANAIVSVALRQMILRGAKAEHILASLGPAIGPCCFEIGEQAATLLANAATGASAHIQSKPLRADLAAINRLQLIENGISPDHIECMGLCTACNPELFFSYRRDGLQAGRHLAVVAIPLAT
ncbi:MAG: peptidoglycan editing factor PgeF [Mariprofundus sp.]|nr:peptidoglycan editing factor PgeF [Mariprofundus sp.]